MLLEAPPPPATAPRGLPLAPAWRNRLLAALPRDEYERLLPALEWVQLPAGAWICDAGILPKHAYFLTDGIASLSSVTRTGELAELAVIGAEGVIGVPLLMGGTSRAVAQGPCFAYRLAARDVQSQFAAGSEFQRVMLRYLHALLTQISLTAVCNLHHSVEQQLCRWLLQRLERTAGTQLRITQELIAAMIGVRRQGIAEAAGRLARLGVITHSRGVINLVSREALLELACECYGVVRQETQRLMALPVHGARLP